MFHRDYLVRHLEHFSRALTNVLVKRRHARYDEAEQDLQHAGEVFLGLDLSGTRAITYEEVMATLASRDAADADHVSMAAELLRERAEIDAVRDRIEAAETNRREALRLYLDLYLNHEGYRSPDIATRIDNLTDSSHLATFPGPLLRLLFYFFEGTGQYARAEDVLFHRIGAPDPTLYDDGTAFYRRLLQEPAERLAAGGLPRHEVTEGFQAFKKHVAIPPQR